MAGLGVAGCGSGSQYEHAKVHGKVTYKGKPVTLGSVLFVPVEPPKDGVMQPASGSIQPDGSYELKSEADAGAIIGEHKVVVVSIDGSEEAKPTKAEASKAAKAAKVADPNAPPAPKPAAAKFKMLVPKVYSDPTTTPITRKVVPGDNQIDIDLAD